MLKSFYILIILLLLQSCSVGYGNKLTANNLNVYFEEKEQESVANALGKFWQSKDLVGDREQNIKLSENEDTYFVHLIISAEFKNSELTFSERKLLLDLQKEMDSTVFKGLKSCEILISDHEFKTLYSINY